MADALAEIDAVAREGEAELAAAAASADALEQWRIKYLGSKGRVKGLMNLIGQAPPEQKKAVGQRANEVKVRLSGLFEVQQQSVGASKANAADAVDVTEPGWRPQIGNRHILMKVVDELTELFGRMGFSVASGPEVEDDFHNFVALNIPPSHPARDPLDNFYLQAARSEVRGQRSEEESGAAPSSLLLRTQTSTVQIRVMETQKPPIRVVIPG